MLNLLLASPDVGCGVWGFWDRVIIIDAELLIRVGGSSSGSQGIEFEKGPRLLPNRERYSKQRWQCLNQIQEPDSAKGA